MLGGAEISWADMVDKTDDGVEFCEGFYKRACNKFKSQVIILTLSIIVQDSGDWNDPSDYEDRTEEVCEVLSGYEFIAEVYLAEEINTAEDDSVGITIALKRRKKQ